MATLTDRILKDTEGRYSLPYERAVGDLLLARVRGNYDAALDAVGMLQDVTRQSMGIASIVGATTVLRVAAQAQREDFRKGDPSLLFADQNIVPQVTFEEALEDFITRAPTTLRNPAERTALRIAEMYSEKRVAAFVRSAEQSVTQQAQDIISEAIRTGLSERNAAQGISRAVEAIRELSPGWDQWYSGVVFRTNVNTATTAGRFAQVQDPDVADVIPALMFSSAGDADTRPSHRLMDGFIAGSRSRVWSMLSPPLGYNCRCQVHLVSRFELEDMGRIRPDGSVIDSAVPPGAKPDDGFRHGGRPDIALG